MLSKQSVENSYAELQPQISKAKQDGTVFTSANGTTDSLPSEGISTSYGGIIKKRCRLNMICFQMCRLVVRYNSCWPILSRPTQRSVTSLATGETSSMLVWRLLRNSKLTKGSLASRSCLPNLLFALFNPKSFILHDCMSHLAAPWLAG